MEKWWNFLVQVIGLKVIGIVWMGWFKPHISSISHFFHFYKQLKNIYCRSEHSDQSDSDQVWSIWINGLGLGYLGQFFWIEKFWTRPGTCKFFVRFWVKYFPVGSSSNFWVRIKFLGLLNWISKYRK